MLLQIFDHKIYIEIFFHRGLAYADVNAFVYQIDVHTLHMDTFFDLNDEDLYDHVARIVDDKHFHNDHICAALNASDNDSYAHLTHFVHENFDRIDDKSKNKQTFEFMVLKNTLNFNERFFREKNLRKSEFKCVNKILSLFNSKKRSQKKFLHKVFLPYAA